MPAYSASPDHSMDLRGRFVVGSGKREGKRREKKGRGKEGEKKESGRKGSDGTGRERKGGRKITCLHKLS